MWLLSAASRLCFRPTTFRLARCPQEKCPNPGRTMATKAGKAEEGTRRLGELRRLLQYWKPEKRRLAAAVGLLFVSSGVTMSVPFALGKIIDLIYAIDQSKTKQQQKAQIEQNLKKFCMGLTGVFLLGGLCNFGRVYLLRVSAQNITARLRQSLYESVMRREVAFFDRNKTGELVNRLSADSQLVSQTVTQQVSDGLRSTVMTVAGVGMMMFMSPQLALVGLGVVPPVAAWAVLTGRKVRKASREVQDSVAAATDLAEERISNVRTVAAFARQPAEVADYAMRMRKVLDVSANEAWIHAKFYGMTGLSGNMIILSVLYYGGSLVTTDVISVGNLASFVLYAAYVGIGLSGVSTFYAEVMKGLGASSRIFEIIDGAEEEARISAKPNFPHFDVGVDKDSGISTSPSMLRSDVDALPDVAGDICVEGVRFSYPTRPDAPIFDDLTFTAPARGVLAVVGSSGSGKSTLAALLLRFYDPAAGIIRIGNTDLKDIDPHVLRQRIGTVAQEPVLFSSSIRDNILYGSLDPENADVEAAAREANAHEFISSFPDGYDTLVGERGVLLSGGQKQRVAIARAIIRDPQILVLDEATSALDAASEHQVKEALFRVMKGRTVITIAHRLSTILNADKIVVLKDGRAAEEGTYEELASTEGGHFKELVTKQTVRRPR